MTNIPITVFIAAAALIAGVIALLVIHFAKKKVPPKTRTRYFSELHIYRQDMSDVVWTSSSYDPIKSRVEKWKDFYKWFFSKPRTPVYMLNGIAVDYCVLRHTIVGFAVKLYQEEELIP